MKTSSAITLMALAALLAACGEKAQTAGARKADGRAWETTDPSYAANGYKAADQASWDQQLRQRAQTQNEYVRVPAKAQ
jgi:major membrane immunogen (membrane-anchored lipoprotein)